MASNIALLAPIFFASSIADSTAAFSPAITTWPGALKFAGSTTAPSTLTLLQASPISSSFKPRIAAIAPTPDGTASCINCDRSLTRETESENSRAPAATKAAYSPKLCPAKTDGAIPPSSSQTRYIETSEINISG